MTPTYFPLTDGIMLNVEQIDAMLAAALEEGQTFEILVASQYDESTRQLKVEANAVALAEMDGQFYITVCLVEDHNMGRQTISGGVDKEYDFRQDDKIFQMTVTNIK